MKAFENGLIPMPAEKLVNISMANVQMPVIWLKDRVLAEHGTT